MKFVQKVVRGAWAGASRLFIIILQLVQFSFISRFLEPGEFGIISLLMTAYFLGISIVNAGFSNGIIAVKDITVEQNSSLFWVNIIVGGMIFLIIYGLSPVFSEIFNAPSLVEPLQVFSLIFIFIPFGQQFEYLLQKNLEFKVVGIVDTIAALFEAIVCVSLAYRGCGVYSFVIGKLLYFGSRSLIFFFVGIIKWRPQFIISIQSIRPFIAFGFFQLGSNFMFVAYSQMPKFIIAPLLGLDAMGYYELANRLTMQPLLKIAPVFKKVAFPAFAQIQDNVNKMRVGYKYYLLLIELSIAPISLMLGLFAEQVVSIVFGQEWLPIVPLVKILAIATFLRSISQASATLALGTKRADLDFYQMTFVAVTALITSYLGVIYGGVTGVVCAVLITDLLTLVFAYFVTVKPLLRLDSIMQIKDDYYVVVLLILALVLSMFLSSIIQTIFVLMIYSTTYIGVRRDEIQEMVSKVMSK